MNLEVYAGGSDMEQRARVHAALGDVQRLAVVDALALSDLTPGELSDRTGLASNHLAFHLGVLEKAGVVTRHRSEGDGRRRYVRLTAAGATAAVIPGLDSARTVLFVCTHNSARSQLAAAMWRERGLPATSAGTHPAASVHRLAIAEARRRGLDLDDVAPRRYGDVDVEPALVVSVCDRANEAHIPFRAARIHWSIPDPAYGTRNDFTRVADTLEHRINRLEQAVTVAG